MSLTRPHDPLHGHPDPRLEARPLPVVRRLPEQASACSCGQRGLHEVSRRHTADGGRLVVLSSGEVRLFHRGLLSPVTVYLPPAHPPLLALLGWASALDAAEVEAELLKMGQLP